MTKETPDIIHYVLTSEKPVGRGEAARAARASLGNTRYVFESMRCLEPAGERLRKGNSKPEQLFRVDRNRIPASCSRCSYAAGDCDPKWRDTTVLLSTEVAPPEDEAA